jgi:hypothetical protein
MIDLWEKYFKTLEYQKGQKPVNPNADFETTYGEKFGLMKTTTGFRIEGTPNSFEALCLYLKKEHQGSYQFNKCPLCGARKGFAPGCLPYPYIDYLAYKGYSDSELRLMICERGHLFLEYFITATVPFSLDEFEDDGHHCPKCTSPNLSYSPFTKSDKIFWRPFYKKQSEKNGLYWCRTCDQMFKVDKATVFL